jgi:hypothetical protein
MRRSGLPVEITVVVVRVGDTDQFFSLDRRES